MRDLKKLKKGDKIIVKNVGYGIVTYEGPDTVIGKRKGRLFTEMFDRVGMEWDEFRQTWKSESGLGLVCLACAIDDPVAVAGLQE